jgi:hypothetical protein
MHTAVVDKVYFLQDQSCYFNSRPCVIFNLLFHLISLSSQFPSDFSPSFCSHFFSYFLTYSP